VYIPTPFAPLVRTRSAEIAGFPQAELRNADAQFRYITGILSRKQPKKTLKTTGREKKREKTWGASWST
jgi:hypothetical protein